MLTEEIERLLDEGIPAVRVRAASVRAAAPAEETGGMLVTDRGKAAGGIGGRRLEERLIREARRALGRGISLRIEVGLPPDEERARMMKPGGTLKFFLEPLEAIPVLGVFGAGTLGAALVRIGRAAGMRTVVVDDDPAFLRPERFPGAKLILTDAFRDLAAVINPGPNWCLVVATRNHRRDLRVIRQTADRETAYLGVLCGKNKKDAFLRRLGEAGISREGRERMKITPGLEIGAVALEEIAVSIIAEIIKACRSSTG